MSYSFLSTFGLTEREITLYQLLISKGQMLVSNIIKESKMKRATVYQSLYTLEKKGLISQLEIAKKIHFKPESPTKLLELANSQLKTYEESQKQLHSIISSLNSKYILSVEKPVISVFEGVDGLKEIYQDMLTVDKPIYAALSVEEVDPKLLKWLDSIFVKNRAAKKIHAYVLIAKGTKGDIYIGRNDKEYRTTKEVDEKKYPFQHELDIYGDKIAFINYRKGEKLIGVVIHHPLIAKTQKALFDLAWDSVNS